MKISYSPLFAATLIAATSFLVPARIHADTYKIYTLSDTNGKPIVGIDTLGQVVIHNESGFDYFTYANGVLVNTTGTLPSLTYDDGIACSVPSGFAADTASVCNNGRTGFGSRFNPNSDPAGVYTGPVSSLTLLSLNGVTDMAFLNGSGDFACRMDCLKTISKRSI